MPESPNDPDNSLPFEVNLSPEEYEREVHAFISSWLSKYPGSEAQYDRRLECADGKYQMDVVVHVALPAPAGRIVILVDAKRRKRIERDDMIALQGKVVSCGANKGVIVTSGRFQSGALEFGRANGMGMFAFIDRAMQEFRTLQPPQTPIRLVVAGIAPTERGISIHVPDDPSELLDELLGG